MATLYLAQQTKHFFGDLTPHSYSHLFLAWDWWPIRRSYPTASSNPRKAQKDTQNAIMSALMTKTSLSVLAGVAGTLFVSYCVYFDHKRRSNPEFKKKLRESESSVHVIHSVSLSVSIFKLNPYHWLSFTYLLIFLLKIERKSKAHKQSSSGNTVLPDLKDHEAVQQFFLQQVTFIVVFTLNVR